LAATPETTRPPRNPPFTKYLFPTGSVLPGTILPICNNIATSAPAIGLAK